MYIAPCWSDWTHCRSCLLSYAFPYSELLFGVSPLPCVSYRLVFVDQIYSTSSRMVSHRNCAPLFRTSMLIHLSEILLEVFFICEWRNCVSSHPAWRGVRRHFEPSRCHSVIVLRNAMAPYADATLSFQRGMPWHHRRNDVSIWL